MKKYIFLSIILLIFQIPTNSFANESTERVMIEFAGEMNEAIFQDEHIDIHHVFESLSTLSATIPSSYKNQIFQKYHVASIALDPVVKISEQEKDWGYKEVLAPVSKQSGWTGKGVKIGIIDTGVQMDHPDLKIVGGTSVIGAGGSYHDEEGHGTHVAGIIGAQDNEIGIVGVAPEAEIYAIKALNDVGVGNVSNIIAGIEWAIQHEMDIINLSLTAPKGNETLEKAINAAYQQGILIIAASGNAPTWSAPQTDVLYPARYENVIAVGSINRDREKSAFSYFGPSLDFVAPGEDIYSTFIHSEYASMIGTSMATPYVTGIAALYHQAYPNYNDVEIVNMMKVNASDLGEPGKDVYYGYGLIQAPTNENERLFIDVGADQWYSDEIEFLYDQKIITGYEGRIFLPDNPVTRAEAITMIGRAKNYSDETQMTRYQDVSSSHYASGYIEKASREGIVNGYPNNTFLPDASIIRGDVATMIQRAYRFPSNGDAGFNDVEKDKYYYETISALVHNNIINGYPDQTFKPLNEITRAEFSALLARVLNESFR